MTSQPLSKKVRHLFGEAVNNFNMISEGDSILVGFSGGKDSSLLLIALDELRKKSPVKFALTATMVVPTSDKLDLTPWENFSHACDVSLDVLEYPIFKIIEDRNERSPCSFCAHMRRGLLASRAKELGCNVLALGHHKDDAVETLLLNLLYTGRIKSFHPNLYMSRTDIRVIRPLVYVSEGQIQSEAQRLEFPILDLQCPYAEDNKRRRVKELVRNLSLEFPDFKSNVIHALQTVDLAELWGEK